VGHNKLLAQFVMSLSIDIDGIFHRIETLLIAKEYLLLDNEKKG
jgi:hypothetical protein